MMNNFENNKIAILKRSKNKALQQGFSILELLIASAVGLVLFAGVLSVFVGMHSTTKETSSHGELQENARFAISVLTDDLLLQNFWGDYTGALNFSSLDEAPGAPATECIGGGINNGTYPIMAANAGNFRTLWGETATDGGATNMSCINDAMPNSDVIQLKRVISSEALPIAPDTTLVDNFSYFVGNTDNAAIFQEPVVGVLPVIKNSRTWQYQHHIYYVKDDNGVPVLRQWRLTSKMNDSPLVDGIERIYFMYGISNVTDPTLSGYGVVNAYVSADNMNDALWDNTSTSILAVKVYVLARSILPDIKYTNDKTYTLGDQASYTPDDNYRRLLLSTTVTLFNSEMDSW